MPDLTTITLFVLASLMLHLTPGPDVLYILARSIGQGRRAGVVSSLGLGAGYLVHTTAAALGLSALLRSSALAYDVVRYLGAAYLVYLGLRTLLSREETLEQRSLPRATHSAIFRQGVLTAVLNPKVALFFLAFLPQFVDPSRGAPVWQFVLFGLLFTTSATLYNTLLALLAGTAGNWLRTRPTFMKVQQWLTGGVLVALGVSVALPERG